MQGSELPHRCVNCGAPFADVRNISYRCQYCDCAVHRQRHTQPYIPVPNVLRSPAAPWIRASAGERPLTQ